MTPRLRSAPGRHASRRDLGSILPRLLLAVASVVLVLGAGEIAVRLLDVGPTVGVVYREIFRLSANPRLGFELRPAVSVGEIAINAGSSVRL